MDENVQFNLALDMVGKEFTDRVKYYALSWWPARSIVQKAVDTRFSVDTSGPILLIEQYALWNGASTGENSFKNRLSLPEAWCGVRDEKLSGIKDCIFVHVNGFIGGNKSYEGALEMLRKFLQMQA